MACNRAKMRVPNQITQLGQLGRFASSHRKMVNVPPNPDPNNLTEKVAGVSQHCVDFRLSNDFVHHP